MDQTIIFDPRSIRFEEEDHVMDREGNETAWNRDNKKGKNLPKDGERPLVCLRILAMFRLWYVQRKNRSFLIHLTGWSVFRVHHLLLPHIRSGGDGAILLLLHSSGSTRKDWISSFSIQVLSRELSRMNWHERQARQPEQHSSILLPYTSGEERGNRRIDGQTWHGHEENEQRYDRYRIRRNNEWMDEWNTRIHQSMNERLVSMIHYPSLTPVRFSGMKETNDPYLLSYRVSGTFERENSSSIKVSCVTTVLLQFFILEWCNRIVC